MTFREAVKSGNQAVTDEEAEKILRSSGMQLSFLIVILPQLWKRLRKRYWRPLTRFCSN